MNTDSINMGSSNLLLTPLFQTHVRLGARMIEFYGWQMPVEYSSTIEEHKAVRGSAGLFDISHMNKLKIKGTGSLQFLEFLSTNDISKIKINGMKYSIICRDDGTIVDDIVIVRREDHFFLITNTSRKNILMNWLDIHPVKGVEIEDVTSDMAALALQGPDSDRIISGISDDIYTIMFWNGAKRKVAGIDTYITRSGYTGEDGFEIYCRSQDAEQLWRSIMEAGDIKPAGLGARDTLRLEMGYILSGTDLTDEDNPLEAGLEWAVQWEKDFAGRNALLRIKKEGVEKKLAGIKLHRGIPRHGYDIVGSSDEKIGIVTSGNISPTLGIGIGLGYMKPEYAYIDTDIGVIIRNKIYYGKVVKTPFLEVRK
ncbi:MAG TPA: glycine cleavage system aminomethyltransferase GcvT [Candidatus Methylomirabilis sp.]|nr:glycine cleavage system aminomethyltransferase GcvT [Candidatus Methylomirabilis sp.]